MNKRNILIAMALFLAFSVNIAVLADQTKEGPPPPPFNPKMTLSGIAGNQSNIFVMAAGKIFQYDLASMKLVKSVDLPDLAPPKEGPPPMKEPPEKPSEQGKCPHHPPMGGPPQGLWTSGNYLYALAGPMLYRYSLPDLKLDLSQELPRPEFPAPPPAGK
jgi:hypothetical protein